MLNAAAVRRTVLAGLALLIISSVAFGQTVKDASVQYFRPQPFTKKTNYKVVLPPTPKDGQTVNAATLPIIVPNTSGFLYPQFYFVSRLAGQVELWDPQSLTYPKYQPSDATFNSPAQLAELKALFASELFPGGFQAYRVRPESVVDAWLRPANGFDLDGAGVAVLPENPGFYDIIKSGTFTVRVYGAAIGARVDVIIKEEGCSECTGRIASLVVNGGNFVQVANGGDYEIRLNSWPDAPTESQVTDPNWQTVEGTRDENGVLTLPTFTWRYKDHPFRRTAFGYRTMTTGSGGTVEVVAGHMVPERAYGANGVPFAQGTSIGGATKGQYSLGLSK